jgi:hypothetical protein
MLHKSLRGSDLHAPSNELVENDAGTPIAAFKVVTFTGIGPLGYPAAQLHTSVTQVIRGVTSSVIQSASGQNTGYITALGFMIGTATVPLNTSAWPIGTKLFSDNAGNLSAAPSGMPCATVLKQDATQGVIYIDTVGFTKADFDTLEFPDALSLELAWDINYPSFYTEPTYNPDGTIASSDTWDSSSKIVHVFHKDYTWNLSGQLTKVVVTRVYDGQMLEKDIQYNPDGTFKNVTRIYTP